MKTYNVINQQGQPIHTQQQSQWTPFMGTYGEAVVLKQHIEMQWSELGIVDHATIIPA